MYWIKSKRRHGMGRSLLSQVDVAPSPPPDTPIVAAPPPPDGLRLLRVIAHPATAAWVQAIGAIVALGVTYHVARLPEEERQRRDKQAAAVLFWEVAQALNSGSVSCEFPPEARKRAVERFSQLAQDRGWERLADADHRLAMVSRGLHRSMSFIRDVIAQDTTSRCAERVELVSDMVKQTLEALRKEGFTPF